MLDIDQQEQIAERGALIAEIMFLAYMVNSHTTYCVFADFSGHVDMMSIQIARSKDRYNDEIASTEFGTKYADKKQPWKVTPLGALKTKRDHLKHILDEGEINLEGMQAVRETVVTYDF
jgi:hypothetical protein